jgi:hypothetical protein
MSSKEYGFVRISRSELYAKVWSTSMLQLAREYGISNVGLAKVCKRHQIPRPSRGFWAKKRAGKAPTPSPLPAVNDAWLESIEFTVDHHGWPQEPQAFHDPDIAAVVAREDAGENPISVAERLWRPHRLVAATRDWLDLGEKSRACGSWTR